MAGKFNPFQSKQTEVVRFHPVADRHEALRLFAKLQRKRPYVQIQIQDLNSPAASHLLEELNGETSVVVFTATVLKESPPKSLPAPLDALVTRLWKNFNKLHIIQCAEFGGEASVPKSNQS